MSMIPLAQAFILRNALARALSILPPTLVPALPLASNHRGADAGGMGSTSLSGL